MAAKKAAVRKSTPADKTDWKALKSAQGPATRVPALARALVEGKTADDRKAAYLALRAGLRGEGVVYPAAAPTVALLCDALAGKKPGAHWAGFLIGEALTAGHRRVLADAAAKLTGDVAAVRAVVRARRQVLLSALGDADPLVRSSAAFALAWATDLAEQSVPALRKQVAVETSGAAALSELLAIGLLAPTAGDRSPIGKLAADGPLFRGGEALSRALVESKVEPASARGLIDLLQAPFDLQGVPWCDGQYDRLVAAVASRAKVSDRMGRAIATFVDARGPAMPWLVPARALISLGGFDTRWQQDDIALPEDLSDVQRDIAIGLARRDGIIVGHGLPTSGRERRRWLGLTPPGPLEKRIPFEGRSWPVWKVWGALYERGLTKERLPPLIAERLDPDETFEALVEVQTNGYGLQSTTAVGPPTAALLEDVARKAGPRAADWARSYADEILALVEAESQPELGGSIGMQANLPVFAVILNNGGTIEPRWYRFVPVGPPEQARPVLEKMPPAQREEAVWAKMNQPAWADPSNGAVVQTLLPVLALVPSKRILDALVSRIKTAKPNDGAKALARIKELRSST